MKNIFNKIFCNYKKNSINNVDPNELYDFVKTVYLMGDTIKKRTKQLWLRSRESITRVENPISKIGN